MDNSIDSGYLPDPNKYVSPYYGGGARFLVVIAIILIIFSLFKHN